MRIKIITIILLLLLILSYFSFGKTIRAATSLDIVINEVAWMGTEGSANDEWIELYNNAGEDVNLTGWGLYEVGGETLIEPLTGIIKAGTYYLIERTDDSTVPNILASQEPSSWGGHGLKNTGEHLQLKNNNGLVIDEVNCSTNWFAGDNKTKQTMERKDSLSSGNLAENWQTSQSPGGTPKAKNNETKVVNGTQMIEVSPLSTPKSGPEELARDSSPLTPESKETREKSYPSGIFLNEILPSPEGPDEEEEWIEFFNKNNFEVDISGWQVTDAVGKTKTFVFPEGTKIGSKGFFVLSRPTSKITLNNTGDGLKLIQPSGNIVDTVTYEKASRGQSYNREESGWVWSAVLTPGSKNIILKAEEKEIQSLPKQNSKEFSEVHKVKEQGLAAISQLTKRDEKSQSQLFPKSSDFLFILLIALAVAFFSGLIVLIMKIRLKKQEN